MPDPFAPLINAIADAVADRVLARITPLLESLKRPAAAQSQLEKLLLDADEAAALLNVSASTVKRLADAGELHRIKLGECVRFTRRELEDFSNAHHAKGAA